MIRIFLYAAEIGMWGLSALLLVLAGGILMDIHSIPSALGAVIIAGLALLTAVASGLAGWLARETRKNT